MQLNARPSVLIKGRRNIMTTIKYKACQNNLGDVTEEQYENFKVEVECAIEEAYPNAEVFVGDSSFANSSEIQINSDEDISRDDIETIANRVFESDKWW